MAWFTARRQDASLPRIAHFRLAVWAPAGVWFGMVMTFGWRAWHRPLLFVNVGLWVGIFIMGWVFRKKRPNNAAHPSS